jgi:hypothetical protein
MTNTDMQPAGATNGQGSSTPVTSITIQGLEFEVMQPYSEGHQLTAGEAAALNQTLAENLRNNFAPAVRKAVAEYRKANGLAEDAEVPVTNLDRDELQQNLDKYAEDYEFGVGRAGGIRAPKDPIEREAHRIAQEKVKAALATKNVKLSSVSKEKMDELVKGVIAKYPAITEEAKRRVSSAADIALEGLGLGG